VNVFLSRRCIMKIRCKICNDIIESLYRHDFVRCSCKAIFIDGGTDYIRIGGTEYEVVKDE